MCHPALGCQNTNNAAPCDDGLFCTTGDACAGGMCVGDDPCPGLLCDEENQACFTPPPALNAHATMTADPSIMITGLAPGGTMVEIAGGLGQSVFQVLVTDGGFVADVPLEPNSLNQLYFTTIAANGSRSAPASARITQDSQPPNLFIDFPTDGAMVTTTDVDVGGRVGDLLSGFMGLNVMVNGVAAVVDVGIGTNGTFVRTVVPLNVGANMVNAMATDQLGNTVAKQISVMRVEIPAGAPRMFIASGNRQSGEVHLPLTDPIVVQVQRGDGTPFADKLVTFKVTRSDGRLATWPGGPGEMMLQVRADENGLAQAFWRMGSDAGCGNNRVEATSTDILGTVLFCASATPGPALQINVGSGNLQRAEVGSQAPEPLRVWVSDTCNGVANVPVVFVVRRGGGKVYGLDQVAVNTSDTGHAEVLLTLGAEPGHNEIEANYPDNPAGMGAFFIAYGVKRDLDMPTSFSGLVMDNGNRPIGGAHITLVVGGTGHFTDTNEQGQFEFENLPTGGPADLVVDGLVATTVGGNPIPPGSFPFLHYEPVLIPNAANSLPTRILLPALNPNNARVYDGTQDVELTVEGIEGLKMLVKAGSMRRRDGSIPTPANPAIIALNQVHHDDVPMPMPDGAAPPFAWTLQPAGATFDPPIQITYPNMSGLPAGSIAYFLSFDHDTMRFEIVASGHVTDDGQSIISDPGAGLTLAGWGCNCPPYSVAGDCCNCGDCETCVNGNCVFRCDSNSCCDNCEACVGGQCVERCDRDECCTEGCDARCVAGECVNDCEDEQCCVNEQCIDLGPEVSMTIDFSALAELVELLDAASDVAGSLGVCDIDPPGAGLSDVQLTKKEFQECCDGELAGLVGLSGGASGLSFGSVECDIPFFGIPHVASLNIRLTASGSVSFSIEGKQTCDDDDFCGNVSISAQAGGGVSGTVGPSAIIGSLSATLEVTGVGADGNYCFVDGGRAKLCFGRVDVVGTVTLLTFIERSISFNITTGACSGEIRF